MLYVLFCFDPCTMSRFRLPEKSIPKDAAYQIIHDELMLDGNPRLNLATFVTTWMEPECDKLMMCAINKNYVDMDEYPITTELQVRRSNAHLARNINATYSSRCYLPLRCITDCSSFDTGAIESMCEYDSSIVPC